MPSPKVRVALIEKPRTGEKTYRPSGVPFKDLTPSGPLNTTPSPHATSVAKILTSGPATGLVDLLVIHAQAYMGYVRNADIGELNSGRTFPPNPALWDVANLSYGYVDPTLTAEILAKFDRQVITGNVFATVCPANAGQGWSTYYWKRVYQSVMGASKAALRVGSSVSPMDLIDSVTPDVYLPVYWTSYAAPTAAQTGIAMISWLKEKGLAYRAQDLKEICINAAKANVKNGLPTLDHQQAFNSMINFYAPPVVVPAPAPDVPPPPSDPTPPASLETPFTWQMERVDLFGSNAVYQGIAVDGDTLHAVSGNGEVTYRRSKDAGKTWEAPVNLGKGCVYLEQPIYVLGKTVVISVIYDVQTIADNIGPRPVGNIAIKYSQNGGDTWAESMADASALAFRQSVAFLDGIFACWMDLRRADRIWDLYCYRRGESVRLVEGKGKMGAQRPAIAVVGSTIHLAWMDGRADLSPVAIEGGFVIPGSTEIYYKRSENGGVTWSPEVKISSHKGYAGRPMIAVQKQTVVVTFDAGTPEGMEVGFVVSNDGGQKWTETGFLSQAMRDSTHSYLAACGDMFACVWMDFRNGKAQVWGRFSKDGTLWSPEERVTSTETGAPICAIDSTAKTVHLLYSSPADGYRSYYQRALRNASAPAPVPPPVVTPPVVVVPPVVVPPPIVSPASLDSVCQGMAAAVGVQWSKEWGFNAVPLEKVAALFKAVIASGLAVNMGEIRTYTGMPESVSGRCVLCATAAGCNFDRGWLTFSELTPPKIVRLFHELRACELV